jgi:hypothetical protein
MVVVDDIDALLRPQHSGKPVRLDQFLAFLAAELFPLRALARDLGLADSQLGWPQLGRSDRQQRVMQT